MLHLKPGRRRVLRLNRPHAPVAVLAVAQLLAWGTLYYGIAFLAPAIAADTGWSPPSIFGAYSAGLLVAALLATPVGHLLVRHGGRAVMSTGSALAAVALMLMAASEGTGLFYAAWLVAGAAMATTLYEAAFSTLREQGGSDFRRVIGVVTLVGGFASTLFWPLTQGLVAELGWRTTALVYAGLNLAVGGCLSLWLPAYAGPSGSPVATTKPRTAPCRIVFPLAAAFACAALATSAVSAHLAAFLAGRPDAIALSAMVLIGPMQVAGRWLEWRLAHRVPVRATGLLAFLGLALGLALLAWNATGVWTVFAFAILYGAANGVLTVVRGGAAAEWLPEAGYAATLGALSTPALVARALAPLATASLLAVWGGAATLWLLVLSALAGLAAFSLAAARVRIPA
ncbi:MAG: MFS transporter [Betaproteobacteria bacterium HGW-Betaproteobacteria-7]|jgi:MFS family permease|nr:MAG: MFS transporter [Betaproteobacteria bacterium HGW-Betaproteobacteria-7]